MADDNIIDAELLESIVEAVEEPGTVTESRGLIPAASVTAEALVDKVAAGMDPITAAHQLGTTIAAMFRDKATSQKVSKLCDKYETSGIVRARLVRARLVEIMLEGTDKNAIAAAKLIGADPEVGIFSGASGAKGSNTLAVQVNIGDETRKVLDRVEIKEGE